MYTVGIDPSLKGTGICTGFGIAKSLIFRDRKGDPKGDKRLVTIREEIMAAIPEDQETMVVCEFAPPYGKGSASLGLVQGVVREACSSRNAHLYLLSPSPLKKFATGYGKADKREMKDQLRYRIGNIAGIATLILDEIESWDDNAVDAWWLRQVGLAIQGRNHLGLRDDQYDVTKMVKAQK